MNRSKKEPPGPQTLLRGFKRLQDIALGTVLFCDELVDIVAVSRFAGHAQR